MRQLPSLSEWLLDHSKAPLAFIFDFDGTLADIQDNPDTVSLPVDTLRRLADLHTRTDQRTIILSGRSLNFLKSIFGDTVHLAGEHGAFSTFFPVVDDVPKETLPLEVTAFLRQLCDQHPGSFMEMKQTAVVWHFRQVRETIADEAVQRYKKRLEYLLEDTEYTCGHYGCVLEIKWRAVNKARYVEALIQGPLRNHTIVGFGDDVPEEEFFSILNGRGVRVAVGNKIRNADFRFDTPADLRKWLIS